MLPPTDILFLTTSWPSISHYFISWCCRLSWESTTKLSGEAKKYQLYNMYRVFG